MKRTMHVICTLGKLSVAAAAVLGALYFFNLDQLVLDGCYDLKRRFRERNT